MLALWVGFVLSLLLVLVPSLYTSCIPLGVLFNTIAYQSKKKKKEDKGERRGGNEREEKGATGKETANVIEGLEKVVVMAIL